LIRRRNPIAVQTGRRQQIGHRNGSGIN
jgi:hypothetical protein